MQPPRALWDIRQALRPQDILVSDVGLHKLWIARMFPAQEPNTVFIANGLAGMGIALPTAIAAKLVHPDRHVVTVNGDGGFLMNVQELETAVRLRTPVVNVIWENRQYGSIVWKQDKKFGRHFGTDFTNPDFVKLADAFGMPAWRCESVEDFARHLRHALTLDLPSLIVAPDRLLDRRGDLGRTRNGDRRRMSTITQDRSTVARRRSRRSCSSAASGATRAGGATLDVEDPSTGEAIASVADATPEDATAALDAACAVQAEWAAHPPRERGEILRRAFEAITERADELALLMTLEMGKPIAESKAEIAYAAEFFRWFAEEAVRIEGRFATAPNGAGPADHDAAAGRPVLRDHAVELPDGDGHAQDRPGDRRRLHDGDQAGAADAAVDVRAGADPRGGRAAGGRAQRRHLELLERRLEADHRRPAAAQAHVHRLDRGRPQARRAVGRRACCAPRWSWAATRRSSSSPTPTSTPPSRAR